MSFLRIMTLAAAFALGTALFGWWTLLPIAFGYGVIARHTRFPGTTAALAGAAAWGALLALVTRGTSIGLISSQLAAVMQLPVSVLLGTTLLFPAVLAGCAATFAAVVVAITSRLAVPHGAATPLPSGVRHGLPSTATSSPVAPATTPPVARHPSA